MTLRFQIDRRLSFSGDFKGVFNNQAPLKSTQPLSPKYLLYARDPPPKYTNLTPSNSGANSNSIHINTRLLQTTPAQNSEPSTPKYVSASLLSVQTSCCPALNLHSCIAPLLRPPRRGTIKGCHCARKVIASNPDRQPISHFPKKSKQHLPHMM